MSILKIWFVAMLMLLSQLGFAAETTTLTKANNTKSLRTTVPTNIVKQFSLSEGDTLEWFLIAEAEGKMGVKIIPIKKQS